MNFSQRSYLPNLDGRMTKSSLKTLGEPKRPLDFVSFDDSEMFCDVQQPRLSDSMMKSPIPKVSKTLTIMTPRRPFSRKASEGKLKSIVLGSNLALPRAEEKKTVDWVSFQV